MLTSQSDVIRRAREVGLQLPDDQRIALGVTLILMAATPRSHIAVRRAERMIADHGRALTAEAMWAAEGQFDAPFIDLTIDTTHGSSLDRHPGADIGAEAPRPRAYISSLRAAWAGLKAAERRFADSIWGDVTATACVALIAVALVIVAGVLQ
ncbi:MAG: hypothetical protein KJ755_16625 [Alphaproteobacteria bacterium]|nr:hypothetical protein [Alphaproteobacteria bacterium]